MTIKLGWPSPADGPALAGLAKRCLPDLTPLHGEDWAHRLGPRGSPWFASLVIAARNDAREIVGFAWADAAALADLEITEPWWCLNAVAVEPDARGDGIGRRLVDTVVQLARNAGVVSVYGFCAEELADWYRGQSFDVGRTLLSDHARKVGNAAEQVRHEIVDERGGLVFVRNLEPDPPARLHVKDGTNV